MTIDYDAIVTCEACGCEMTQHTDYIGVKNADGEHLGHIFSANPAEDWGKIANGDCCPICEGWEDGLGNECTVEGWDNRALARGGW